MDATQFLAKATFAFCVLACVPIAVAQEKKSAPLPDRGSEAAQLIVYHKCSLFSALSASGHVYVADRNLGPSPVCSVRSFKVPTGEHAIQIRDWAGLSFGLLERKLRFTAGQSAHIVVGKSPGGAFFWEAISAPQGRALAQEIKGVGQ